MPFETKEYLTAGSTVITAIYLVLLQFGVEKNNRMFALFGGNRLQLIDFHYFTQLHSSRKTRTNVQCNHVIACNTFATTLSPVMFIRVFTI